MSLTRAARRAPLALAGALCVAWALVSLTWPPGFDHGLYTWAADVTLRGGVMYRDAWDMHGPLVPYAFAAPAAVVGRRFWGVRLVDLALLALGTAALWRLVARAGPAPSRTAGWWVSVLFVLTYASLGYNETAQPDGWVGVAAAAAYAPVLLADRPRAGTLAAAGLATGLFTLVKPVFVLLGAVPLAYLLVRAWAGDPTLGPAARGPARRRAAAAGAVLAAATAVPVAAAAVLFAARGALTALVEVHLRYPVQIYSGGGFALGSRLGGLAEFVWRGKVVPVALAAAGAGVVALWHSGQRALLAAVAVWLSLTVGFVLLQNKFYYYHWIATLPPLALLAAYGLAPAFRKDPGAPVRALAPGAALAAASVAVIGVHAALRPVAYVAQGAAYVAGLRDRDAYYAGFDEGGPSGPLARERVAAYLRDRVPAGQGVVVWGTDAGILYLSGQAAPFRLGAWYWPIVNGRGTAVQAGYVREYVRSLRDRPPAYLVVNRAAGEVTPGARLAAYPGVATAVAAQFVADTTLGPFDVLRRRDVGGAGARGRGAKR